MIAMALSCRPRVLIADEPTTALDVTTQAQILNLLEALQRELGTAIIMITHDLGVIAETAHDVAVMYLGRIVEHASVEIVLVAPKHPYTRGLLASIPRIGKTYGQRLASIEGSVPEAFACPPGCPFHPRCPECMPGVCDTGEAPRPRTVAPEHFVACHLYPEDGRGANGEGAA